MLFRTDTSRKKGFTLFFAVLVTTLLLAVGLAILELSIKELELSALGRESQFAFYSADSGAECALYWDTVGLVGGSGQVVGFATSSNHQLSSGASITCGSSTLNVVPSFPSSGIATHQFRVQLIGERCADVYIEKDSTSGSITTTVIEVRGYNRCTGISRTRTERGILVTY